MGIFKKKKEDQKQVDKKPADLKQPKKKEEKKASMKDLYDGAPKKAPAKESTQTTTKEKTEKKSTKKTGLAYRVLVKPLITEKAANLGAMDKYVFAVSKNSNKIEISNAINEVYGVRPINVNIINVK